MAQRVVKGESVVSVDDAADRVSCVLVGARGRYERRYDFGTWHQPAALEEGHASTVRGSAVRAKGNLEEIANMRSSCPLARRR